MKKLLFILLVVAHGLSGPLLADDTDIYGGSVSVSVEPNILLILDNSGSMGTSDVPTNPFVSPYAGTYPTDNVYRRECVTWTYIGFWTADVCSQRDWVLQATSLPDITPASFKTDLETDGYATYSSDDYRTGSYRNYLDDGGSGFEQRIVTAKRVLSNLIDNTTGVRFGLMKFHTTKISSRWDGGQLVAGCGTLSDAALKTEIDNITADTWTPLGETLANAGQYFAGQTGWYHSEVYTSPIQYKCQKNYIILMTDGAATHDGTSPLGSSTTEYILSGEYMDSNDLGVDGQYLDDVANFLVNNDLIPGDTLNEASDPDFWKQSVTKIYTIGFQTDQTLLNSAATLGKGAYYTAGRESDLYNAFQSIIAQILETNASYVAPVVPVSNVNRTFSGQYIYFGFFKPQATTGRWFGNIKKLKYENDEFIDANGVAADENGVIKSTATTYWSTTSDGETVEEGGVGGVLKLQATRNIYTYTNYTSGTEDERVDLTNGFNAFVDTNTRLTTSPSGLPNTAETVSAATINDVSAWSSTWPLGDVLHSEPIVIHYSKTQAVIYVGSNDGMLHCFDDATGEELWAFVPPAQLNRMTALSDGTHSYFIDGSAVIYNQGDNKTKTLIIGERRGGKCYYVLDVTNYSAPKWKYQIGSNS